MAQMPFPLLLLIIQCKVKCPLTEREHSFTLPSMGIINKQSPHLINAFHMPCTVMTQLIGFPVHSNTETNSLYLESKQ